MCLTVSDHFPKQHVRGEAQKHPHCVTISVESSQRLILDFQLVLNMIQKTKIVNSV